MQRRTITISAAALTIAAAITGLIVWLIQPSYDDIVKDCQKALAAQLDADGKGRPDACKDVKDDDFDALLMNAILGNEGWLGEDGRFDENKMLEDTLDDMP
ncbi:hypothetical protein [Streptomyces hirsutus]|uniref:hypothetical protein n=1 Tax=Streptomyces hirsutus TaxID=35620 RepID=UPI0036D0382E